MTPLLGQDAAVAAFLESMDSGRLHHAWLISGAEGIGKALFADKAALRVLANAAGPEVATSGLDVPDEHRIARLFSTTPSLSPWRVLIIDSIDDLERPAANALLKNLEEPPSNSLFLLVSHSPERLLPTIRSRCRQLRLLRLDDAAMTSALRTALPDAKTSEINELAAIGEGSPGRALAFRGLEIGALEKSLEEIVRKGDPTNSRRSALAQALALKSAQPRYEAFLARAPSIIASVAKQRRGAALAEALRLWERAHDLAGSATRLSLDPQSVVFELAGMLAALAPRKTTG